MRKCMICERIKDMKKIDRNGISTTFRVALIEDSNRNGGFRGRLTHRAVSFNFCPICGKKYSKSSLYIRADRLEGGDSE